MAAAGSVPLVVHSAARGLVPVLLLRADGLGYYWRAPAATAGCVCHQGLNHDHRLPWCVQKRDAAASVGGGCWARRCRCGCWMVGELEGPWTQQRAQHRGLLTAMEAPEGQELHGVESSWPFL